MAVGAGGTEMDRVIKLEVERLGETEGRVCARGK